ncbi:hypothetical protein [Natronorubrum halalkaliphilum]|nr:hypothetical protein [Natronorubrum halalkaliphilum]
METAAIRLLRAVEASTVGQQFGRDRTDIPSTLYGGRRGGIYPQ